MEENVNKAKVIAKMMEWTNKANALREAGADLWYDMSLYAGSLNYYSAAFNAATGLGTNESKVSVKFSSDTDINMEDVAAVDNFLAELLVNAYTQAQAVSAEAQKRVDGLKSLMA